MPRSRCASERVAGHTLKSRVSKISERYFVLSQVQAVVQNTSSDIRAEEVSSTRDRTARTTGYPYRSAFVPQNNQVTRVIRIPWIDIRRLIRAQSADGHGHGLRIAFRLDLRVGNHDTSLRDERNCLIGNRSTWRCRRLSPYTHLRGVHRDHGERDGGLTYGDHRATPDRAAVACKLAERSSVVARYAVWNMWHEAMTARDVTPPNSLELQ
ncbi:hypothetical protein SAMN04515660_2228 [Luteibacter sp. 329MFSha]|nr:hypothetical protein SAMN04515660_2228 [Luteibacter sp. 329MFSha]